MAGIPNSSKEAKRLKLLEELPNHEWSWWKAGIAAGYSEHYAKTCLKTTALKDKNFAKALVAKRREIEAEAVDKRENVLGVLDSIIEKPDASDRDRIQACLARGKMCGWLSETRILETRDRQLQLTEAEKAVAAKAALVCWDTRQLPDGSYATDAPESCDTSKSGLSQ